MKFTLKNVGKIATAEFSIKPLTIFIGKNDSGKTYAASSLWAIVNFLKKEIQLSQDLESEIMTQTSTVLNGALTNTQYEYTFDSTFIQKVLNDIKVKIDKKFPSILKSTFNFNGFDRSAFSLTKEIVHPVKFSISTTPELSEVSNLEPLEEARVRSRYKVIFTLQSDELSNKYVLPPLKIQAIQKGFVFELVHERLREYIIGTAFSGNLWSKLSNILYIPAARTGIVLALNYFLEGSNTSSKLLDDAETNENNNLTAPLSDFARKMQVAFFSGRKKSASESLISELIQGEININDNNIFHYQPLGVKQEIPLASSSSLVTELAPLAVLDSSLHNSFIIFEEPEAHLHLEAQREIAKAIIRLINNGCYLLITTHSDTFIQQINNLILLERHSNKKQLLKDFELTEDDITAKKNVAAYDFNCSNNKTIVKKLAFEQYGFVAQSLNEVLISLSNQTLKIIDDPEEVIEND